MNDPMEEIFNGTPEPLDKEDLERQAALEATLDVAEEPEVETESDGSTESSQPKEESSKEEKKPEENKDGPGIGERIITGLANKPMGKAALATVDTATDLFNHIPGVNIPKIPKFQSKTQQTIREIAAVMVPTAAASYFGAPALGFAAKGSKIKFLADPLVKFMGEKAFVAGVGAGVDYVSSTSKEGDNLSGTLKKYWPNTFAFIPEDIATMDGDSPDLKRNKTVAEGTGIGLFTDFVEVAAKVTTALRGTGKATEWVPETEKARNWFAKNSPKKMKKPRDLAKAKKRYIQGQVESLANPDQDLIDEMKLDPKDYTPAAIRKQAREQWKGFDSKTKQGFHDIYFKEDDVMEDVASNTAKRSDALDKTGEYNFTESQRMSVSDTSQPSFKDEAVDANNLDAAPARNTTFDEPIFGVHDMYDFGESGIRTTDDFGIVGASVDFSRIKRNKETVYGRLGSVVPDHTFKAMAKDAGQYQMQVTKMRDDLREAGEYGYRFRDGSVLNSKTIREDGDEYARYLGYLDAKQLEAELMRQRTNVDGDTGMRSLGTTAAVAVKKYQKEIMRQLGGVADAYARTSVSGQVSDMAQGFRYVAGSSGETRTAEELLDRIQVLYVMGGEAGKMRAFALKALDIEKRTGKRLTPAQLRKANADVISQLQAEAAELRETFDLLRRERPRTFGAMMLAYENTDGAVKTIDDLNNYAMQSLSVIKKAVIDGQPDIPSVILRGFWANVYNNTLSAAATPIKAIASNAALLVERPVATMAGAIMTGDTQLLRRGFYQYSTIFDSMRKGAKYFGETMRRSGIDPNYTGGLARESNIIKNEKQLEILNAFADAKAAEEGLYGPQVMMAHAEMINDLAEHPLLRLGNRLMMGSDGFVQAFIANVEARGRAFDMLEMGRIDADLMADVEKKAYEAMWTTGKDGNRVITDSAVKAIAGEIAMNLDSKMNDSLSGLIAKYPVLKPFLLYTKTPINIIKFFGSHNPAALLFRQLEDYRLPFDLADKADVERLLTARGVATKDPHLMKMEYTRIRAEMRGRKAIGGFATLLTVGLFLNDSITGDGHYDVEKQRVRRELDWKKRMITLPDGTRVSYDGLGAISDWMAVTANIMDNFDALGEGGVAELLHASGYVISAALTDKTMLSGIEPLYDMLNGNAGAFNRWASSFIPAAMVPGSSQIAELSRLMMPQLKVVEERLDAMIANRTPLKAGLPDLHDYIDGDVVGIQNNFFARAYNEYSPFKVNGKISPEKQFLIDIEFDARPSMDTDGRGVKLTLEEQAKVYDYMGKEGLFKKAIQDTMATTDAKEFRAKYKKWQKEGKKPILKDFESIHLILRQNLSEAKALAISQIDAESGGKIERRRFEQNQHKNRNQVGSFDDSIFIPTR